MSAAVTRNGRALQAYALASKQGVVKRLRDAMSAIEREIDASEGVYPRGKLTQKELCARAGVTQATLQKATHKGTTLVEVNAWLDRVAKAIRTSKAVGKVVTDKIEGLKQRNADLMQRYHECELELVDAKDRISKLESQIESLAAQGQGRITSISAARSRH